jgi:hypothetical protein
MEPTQNGRHPGCASQPGLFDQLTPKPEEHEVQPGLSADSNVPLRTEPLNTIGPPESTPSRGPVLVPASPGQAGTEPLWAQRLKLVVFVLFCIELGMLLAVLPWTRVWAENSLLAARPALRAFLQHDFIRGAFTGLGLVDIWLGIREAVTYRENRA